MCQLLGMNCAVPADITFSFTGFAARGGKTDHHGDGFGIGFFEGNACRLLIDTQPSSVSPMADLIKRYPIKSTNVIAHIRKATHGAVNLENCHPFMLELWGRHWLFAHNGNLRDYRPSNLSVYRPIGSTDSENAFCALLEKMREYSPDEQPPLDELFRMVEGFVREVNKEGTFNFLLSNGQVLFAHCSTRLQYLIRQWPFSQARLIDADLEMDFSRTNGENDRIAVIATTPLTQNENWTSFEPGELLMFSQGLPVLRTLIPIPEDVQKRNAEDRSYV